MDIQWSLVFYSLFLGIAIGPFAVAALTDGLRTHPTVCRWGAVLGLASLGLAGLAAFAHLGQPLRALNVLHNLGSPLARETLATCLTGVLAALYAAHLWSGLVPAARRGVAGVGLAGTVLSAFMLGVTYMVPARPMWNTWLVPLTLVASSIPVGLLAMVVVSSVVPPARGEPDRAPVLRQLARWTLGALVAYAALAALYLLGLGAAAGAAGRLLAGDLALPFWLGLVGVGLIAPFLLALAGSRRGAAPAVAGLLTAAFVLVLVGGIVIRALVFALGTRVPLVPLS